MDNHDWERFGEDIRKTIQNAVEYGNYDKLNQTISSTLNQATDWINRSSKNLVRPTRTNEVVQKQQNNQIPTEKRFKINTSYKVAGVLFTVCGGLFGALIFLWALILIIVGAITMRLNAGFWASLIPSLIFAGGFSVMAIDGILRLTRMHRFNLYKKEIGHSELCNLSVLSSGIGKSVAYVRKDVEKMIRRGWFRQGHLDKQKTCLMVTDKMYQQYQQLEHERALLEQEQQEIKASRDGLDPQVKEVIEQGDYYIKKIRECNDAIPGKEISEKIHHIELVVDKIFERVKQQPESVEDIRKMMEYYLPTTVKLLEAYAQMDAQPVGGENIQNAKREIEATLDTLNMAFEKLLDSLFQDVAWDVSSDISVLNTILAQEGLKDDGLRK